MWEKTLKLFLVLYIPFLLLSVVILVSQRSERIENIASLQQRETHSKREYLEDLLSLPVRNIQYWSKLNYPQNFQPLGVDDIFMSPYKEIVDDMTDYDQFRFIDLNGNEILRYESKEDSIILGALQNKSSRDYFKKAIGLNPGEIYISEINLNRENGKIELPIKPVVRLAAPIFDTNNSKLGIVVINYRMIDILNKLRSNIADNNFYLINDDFQIITSNTIKDHIPFENGKFEGVLKLPNLNLKQVDTYSRFSEDGNLWTVDKVDLKNSTLRSLSGRNFNTIFNAESQWYIVQETPALILNAQLKSLYWSILIFNILSLVLLLGLSFFIVKIRAKKDFYFNILKNKNEALLKSKNELKDSNRKISMMNHRLEIRNKQLNEFNYLVSHNLRAPVTSMSVLVNMIKSEQEPQMINELLPKLTQVADSISDLTEDIGEYVSILDEKKGGEEDVNIVDLIKKIKNEFAEVLLATSDFSITVDAQSWDTIHFSKFYLHSILQNLISNSIKFRKGDVSSNIHFQTSYTKYGSRELTISDNGLGIDMKRHGDNIFKLYKRFHRNISGKGIGLFLVKSQLEAMDATITVQSQQNVGTTFKINFNDYERP